MSLRQARESGQAVRVASLTSETTEVYALPNGQFRADISTGMQRFRRDGRWIDADQRLKVAQDGSVVAGAHPGDLRISGAQPDGEHELAAVGLGVDRVAMTWTGKLPAPRLEGTRATYVDARPGVDLVVEATRRGFEQFLIVKDRTAVSQVASIGYGFRGAGAAALTKTRTGAITLSGAGGTKSFEMPAPLMWDATTTPAGSPAGRRPVRTEVAGMTLTLKPDLAWLRDANTRYPVTIDPTLNPAVTTFDTYVRETVTTDQNAEPDLQIGLLATTPATLARSFLTWDTTVLVGKQITASTVSFWNYWSHTCTATAWSIYTTGTSTYTTTFANQPAWDASPDATSTSTHGSTDCADNWATIDGKNFFQKAATAGKTRAGMGVRAVNETATAGFKQFRSREGASATEDPKASITYNSWPTVTARATVPATSCVTGTSRPLVNTLTPQLKATVTDADGTAMTVTFEWWTLTGTAPVGSVSVASVATGGTATATVPAGALAEGGSYRWRVKASDGTAGSDVPTSFCELTVYDTAPPVAGCHPGTDSDFNGDGVEDVAIADPRAVADGKADAGQIHVAYGGGVAARTLNLGNSQTGVTAAAGDQFGYSISAYDANNDGCTDLAVGVPYKDLGSITDAGAAYLLFGAPGGLATGPASLTYHQDSGSTPETAEAQDDFGFSVSGNRTPKGQSYLVIGAPGEDVGTAIDAGVVHFYRGSLNLLLQSGTPIPGSSENDDQNGYAVAAGPNHFAVGSPGEAIGTLEFAGAVNLFSSWEIADGLPKPAANLFQDATNVSETSEANDTFGKAVAVAAYRPAGAAAGQADSLVVVGVPGEDTTVADGGQVQRFHVTAAATFVELPAISGTPADGNYLGESVAVVNTAPASEGSNATMFIAAGAPGEDLGETSDAGRVRVYPALVDPITAPVLLDRRDGSLAGEPRTAELVGTSLTAGATRLWVGTPYGDPAVHGFPWADLAAGTAAPATVHRPGDGGIPAGATAFGSAIG
ncbi:DNRLRE domain-containing protein [Actinoplanes sp. NPDC049265]|uniref:DNRLRE domain-containing protein n=1 Tax=Actinoplanes sp. NPDC049265 TaxID=3363902 RepID=UPI003713317C